MFNINHFLTQYARIEESDRRTQWFHNELSNPALRDLIKKWLENNNIEPYKSPITLKIRWAIHHHDELQNSTDVIAKQRFQETTSDTERPNKRRKYEDADKESIEIQLIRKNFGAIKRELNENPRHVYSLTNTFKTHLKLGTLTINELLEILESVSQRMIDIQNNRGVVSSTPFQLKNYSSILRLYNNELVAAAADKSLREVPSALYIQNCESCTPLESLQFWTQMLHLSPASCRLLFSSTPLSFIVKILSFKNIFSRSLIEYPSTFFAILPILLDTIPTHYLHQIFRESILDDSEFTPIDFCKIEHLSDTQVIRFITITNELSKLRQLLDIKTFPRRFRQFYRMLNQRDMLLPSLNLLTEDENHAAIANLMEAHKISVKAICNTYPHINLELLARHLRYVDLRGFNDSKEFLRLLANNTQISTLYITDPTIVQIPLSLDRCIYLNCGGCINLISLPKLPECMHLICYNCPLITQLPGLDLCERLICWGCTKLLEIPPLAKCKELNCDNCPSLRRISYLPLCEHLECRNCKQLLSIPDLEKCKFLDCFGCKNLEFLPMIPRCLELHCGGCPKVRALPMTLSQHLVIYSSNIDYNLQELNVDTSYFKKYPKELLLYWGYYLTKCRNLPTIVYYSDNERSEGHDAKGMTRDFITNLIQQLFKPLSELQPLENQDFLAIEDGLPYELDQEDQVNCYKALGWTLALAYKGTKFIKTGPLFSELFYDCLQTKGEPSLNGESLWPLQNWLKILGAPVELIQILDTEIALPEEVSDMSLQYLSYLLDSDGTIQINREQLNDPEERQSITNQLLQKAIEDKKIRALSYIADAFYYYLGELLSEEILVHTPISLRRQIEGKISKKLLLKKVNWGGIDLANQSHVHLQRYFKVWLLGLNQDDLIIFLRCISGLAAVPDNVECKIDQSIEPNSIPTVQTCSYEIFFSQQYDNQEIFNKRMSKFLEYALSGTGYQIV